MDFSLADLMGFSLIWFFACLIVWNIIISAILWIIFNIMIWKNQASFSENFMEVFVALNTAIFTQLVCFAICIFPFVLLKINSIYTSSIIWLLSLFVFYFVYFKFLVVSSEKYIFDLDERKKEIKKFAIISIFIIIFEILIINYFAPISKVWEDLFSKEETNQVVEDIIQNETVK